ncbi:hypothetical protein CFP56_017184 [Quercus suber]|uniref:Uncharacterized protein n=1 Tax=Quercus suber TaxID=58331 RepID=A0AAW0KQ03_QUESU
MKSSSKFFDQRIRLRRVCYLLVNLSGGDIRGSISLIHGPKQIRVAEFNAVDGIYAGSAFVTSPPPSSLPVPGFLGKNGPATSDLRRLLGLD